MFTIYNFFWIICAPPGCGANFETSYFHSGFKIIPNKNKHTRKIGRHPADWHSKSLAPVLILTETEEKFNFEWRSVLHFVCKYQKVLAKISKQSSVIRSKSKTQAFRNFSTLQFNFSVYNSQFWKSTCRVSTAKKLKQWKSQAQWILTSEFEEIQNSILNSTMWI